MPQAKPKIRRSQRPRPDGRLTFIARHMGVSLATYYKYRKGIWPQPYDYAERHAAAESAWDNRQSA
jgi:ACT domain-containing protein